MSWQRGYEPVSVVVTKWSVGEAQVVLRPLGFTCDGTFDWTHGDRCPGRVSNYYS